MTGRLFTIGDIHGCAAELETLLRGLPLAAGDTLVFAGDYLDRGPACAQVLDLVIETEQREDIRTICLKGNHEDMCLAYLGRDGQWGEAWLENGGHAALRSWGVVGEPDGPHLAAMIPPAHLAFLERLQQWHLTEQHLVVHAGIRPEIPLAEQDPEDLHWIREDFLHHPHPLPQTVVFGHTPFRDVFVDLPYKIGIDTGCVYGGALTCLAATDGRVFQVRRGERHVRERVLSTFNHRA